MLYIFGTCPAIQKQSLTTSTPNGPTSKENEYRFALVQVKEKGHVIFTKMKFILTKPTSGSVDRRRQYMYARSRRSGLSVSTVALFKTTWNMDLQGEKI